ARISPLHLPAMCDVAADLDGLAAPIRIVNPTELGACTACSVEHRHDEPVLGAIGTVYATDAHGFRRFTAVCALHLAGVVTHYGSHGWPTVVEVPASPRWFERTDRETYYALDETRGVAATRGIWDAWQVVEVVDGFGADQSLMTSPSRVVAEAFAQAYAAGLAADAYESGFVIAETVVLPVVAAVTEAA
ncbi:MAG: hypothetical protein L0I24_01125, partial [Pseudonocardia sp.]|nr:hypothetical protein [Pseudonocardia sp.]